MKIRVVIVTRNTRALTCAAAQSVLDSQDDFNKEIVVVDNASTDGTEEAMKNMSPALTYIRSESNLGFARANNAGARGFEGDFLLLLNSDARLKNNALAAAVTWMTTHPQCGVAGARLLNPDGSPQNAIANFPSLATELLNKSLLRRLAPHRYPGKERALAEPLLVESVVGAFMLIRMELWRALGGLDERFFFFFEETDFCLQARRAGWQVWHLPQVEVWHEQGRSAKQTPAPARIEYWRSRYQYFSKNHAPLTCALLRLGLLLRLAVNSLSSGAATLLTLGRAPGWRAAWKVSTALRRWHWQRCPAEMGLPR
ncbi:MAG TPA: glycosyltransferase family 2 protein [Verrucomicrobiae bacterium]|jgi:hypothetical protein|nr:glycosyltransferase family 2 protein [Verrucomicrobiae bacterium]